MKYLKLIGILVLFPLLLVAQDGKRTLVDKVVGIVGDNIILMSDIELQYEQYKLEGNTMIPNMKCELMNQMLVQKMFLQQAQVDSVVVTDDEVESELDRRMRYFTSVIGSEERLEEYYGKSIILIKDEFRKDVEDQLLAQRMQGQILEGMSVTPAEVKAFYNSIPKDSIPYFDAEVEVGVIVNYPDVSESMKLIAKEKLEGIRQRIIDGQDFAFMAGIHSKDLGTKSNGGDLGYFGRGQMVNEFEAVAFSLKPGEMSEVFETEFGYHILLVEERKGEKVKARHILIKPEVTSADLEAAQIELEAIKTQIDTGGITFAKAVAKYSEDEETKNSGGMLINPQSGNSFFEMDQVDQQINFVITNMEAGDISDPTLFIMQDGTEGYRLVYLKSESPPHVANLQDDYYKIKAAALSQKEEKVMREWMEDKAKETYVYIESSYQSCDRLSIWIHNDETVERTYE